MTPSFFETQADFRRWLSHHYDSASELWVGFYKRASGKPSITWPESVDQALCFGWIDGIRKSLGPESYAIRFTPRKPDSIWSAVNTRRVRELRRQGLMRPAGLDAFSRRDARRSRLYSFERDRAELTREQKKQFRDRPHAWEFYRSQPPWYRKTAAWWVMSAKREETRQHRLATLIADSQNGRRIAPLRRANDGTNE